MIRHEIADKLLSLTSDEITDYLVSVKSRPDCPFCDHIGWKIMLPKEQGIAGVPMANFDQKGIEHWPIIVMFCEQCSFMRSHYAFPIIRFIEEKNGDR